MEARGLARGWEQAARSALEAHALGHASTLVPRICLPCPAVNEALERDMFGLVWGPTLAAVSVVLDNASDGGAVRRALNCLLLAARMAAFHQARGQGAAASARGQGAAAPGGLGPSAGFRSGFAVHVGYCVSVPLPHKPHKPAASPNPHPAHLRPKPSAVLVSSRPALAPPP